MTMNPYDCRMLSIIAGRLILEGLHMKEQWRNFCLVLVLGTGVALLTNLSVLSQRHYEKFKVTRFPLSGENFRAKLEAHE